LIEKLEIPVYWDLSELKSLKNKKEIVSQFEVYLVREFLKEAKKSLPKGIFDSFPMGIYSDLFDMEISEVIGNSFSNDFSDLFERALDSYNKMGTK